MKHIFSILSIGLLLLSCTSEVEDKKKEDPQLVNETLIETIDGIYYEYYPGKKQVKITGPVDSEEKRHGTWEFYNERGEKRGFNIYKHGKRHGHSYSSYPNGAPLYHGEYWEDTLIGVWKHYDKDGKVKTKDHGLPEGY